MIYRLQSCFHDFLTFSYLINLAQKGIFWVIINQIDSLQYIESYDSESLSERE